MVVAEQEAPFKQRPGRIYRCVCPTRIFVRLAVQGWFKMARVTHPLSWGLCVLSQVREVALDQHFPAQGTVLNRGTSQSNKKNKQRKRAEPQRRAEARDRPAQESATRGDEQRRERDPPMVVQNLSYYDNTNASSNNAPVQRRKPTGF